MAERMLKFVSLGREMPEKRLAEARARDFDEIYAEFADAKAAEQSARCSQCGVPFCQTHCPLHNNIPDWLKLTAEGRLEEAYQVSRATNTFPEICGRICPQDRLCEGSCVIEQSGHGTVTIGAVEKYITDTAWERGWVEPIRPLEDRPESVGIIGAGPAGLAAAEQSARCSQCGVPFCQTHCPLHNNIPDWLKLTAEGRLEEAYQVSRATNTFPEICGRICPQDRLCEGSCVIEQSGHGTVTIGAVEKYITDTAWERGWVQPIRPLEDRPETVGIIGAGPAGLAAAERLRSAGFGVTVYDRYDRAGGLMIYGIPGFKLEKEVVERYNRLFEEGGIEFRLNCRVGEDESFEALRERHDAILIATGVYKSRDLAGPGSGTAGIVQAIDYLTASNRKGFGDEVPAFDDGTLDARAKRVVVIGGGDTAMDCVRTAVRQGATSVKCLYRRDRQNMPGSRREVANAEEEGVEFVWLTAPKGFTGTDRVSGVRAVRMRLGAPDQTGRMMPEEVAESDFTEPCDLAIKALGFEPEELPKLWGTDGLEVTRWGTVKADFRTHATSLPGVYAAGDIVRGASLVVWAIRDGREAADAIAGYLGARVAVAAE